MGYMDDVARGYVCYTLCLCVCVCSACGCLSLANGLNVGWNGCREQMLHN